LDVWLNASAYGLGLAVAAWAVARPRLLDAAWRCRVWTASLAGLAALLAWPLFRGSQAAASGASVVPPPGAVVPPNPGPAATALIALPAVDLPMAALVAAWASVALWQAASLAVAVARIRSARAAALPFPAPRARRLPEWAAANAGRFELAISDRVAVPSMLGFGRPMVAVPAAWLARLSDEALDAVLLHELAHAERRDDLAELAERLLVAACWFHPASWFIARRLTFEREAACDERAARLTTRRRYARCLMTIADGMQDGRWTARTLVASSTGRRSDVARRVEYLVAFDGSRHPRRARFAALAAVVTATGLAAAAPALPPVFGTETTRETEFARDRSAAAPDPGSAQLPRVEDAAGRAARAEDGGEKPAVATAGRAKMRQVARPARRFEDAGRGGQVKREARHAVDSATAPLDASFVTADRADGSPGPATVARGFPGPSEARRRRVECSPVSPPQLRATQPGWTAQVEALLPASPPPGGGQVVDPNKGRRVSAAPFRALGSAFSKAGAATGRWFSRAGTEIAAGVTPR
jgi:beta-lactamase regulating signal transducer with metallopeptidase domain